MAKKILFLMNSMQGYEKEIIKGFQRKGFDVDWYRNSSKIPKQNLTFLDRIIRSIAEDFYISSFKKILYRIEERFYLKDTEDLKAEYDYILDIGSKSSPNFMKILNSKSKGKKILYIWDDLRYDKRSELLISIFDEVYSYSPQDSQKYRLKYRPNFFVDIFNYMGEEKNNDIFYIGNMREKERTIIIKKIDESFPNLNKYIKLCGKFKIRYIDRFLSFSTYKKYFIQKQFNVLELGEAYKNSKILLDITLKTQVGLGLRPIESIGSKCKLITTNENIKKYDFYNENNIFVLKKDFSNLNELKVFVDKPYIDYSEEIRYKYSIDGFIDEVFN